MKNASLVLNAILLLAVGFLYYKVFSENKTAKPAAATTSATPTASGIGSKVAIAYVDLDSLNEHIDYIKDKRKSLESEQKAIENEWTNSMRNLESQADNFRKRAASITQAEAEQFQANMYKQQQDIEAKKQNSAQRLSEKSAKFLEEIQKNLKDYLHEYNKDKGYTYILTYGTGLDYMVYKDSSLNITTDVIGGMNERMKGK